MLTITIPSLVAAAAAAILLILLISTTIFVRWVLKTVGVVQASEAGNIVAKGIEGSTRTIEQKLGSLSSAVSGQNERIIQLSHTLVKVLQTFTPEGVEMVIESRAQEIAQARVNSELKQRQAAEQKAKAYEKLLRGLTGSAAELGEIVRDGLPVYLPDALAGRLESFCGQRGVRVGRGRSASLAANERL